mmetsp:Transcript_130945/g.195094  ORF Transcript_130945/g.195094 Transcript_130945/m.195094 type:complete len:127 (+) Transcript_130945:2-382(+)
MLPTWYFGLFLVVLLEGTYGQSITVTTMPGNGTASATPSVSFTHSITPTPSITPSITPPNTPTSSTSYAEATETTTFVSPTLGNWKWFNLALGIALAILTAGGVGAYIFKLRREKNAIPSYNDGVF